jgi:Protein of unknown function (DUF2442)
MRSERLNRFTRFIRERFGLGGASAFEPRIRQATVTDSEITLRLTDGRIVISPLSLYPTLQHTPERRHFEIVGRGIGLHWPTLDYDLSLEGMLSGAPEYRPAQGIR